MTRKAKIVCTLGPATSTPESVIALVKAGMDVARLNFSHGDRAFHSNAIQNIRNASIVLGKPVAILQDLQGIKIRVGKFKDGPVFLKKGSRIELFPGTADGDSSRLYVSYPRLLKDVLVGERILLDDGLLGLKVESKTETSIIARVVEGGMLKERKGVNFPDSKILAESFTEKDRSDVDYGIEQGVDYIAVSFVREAGDIEKVRKRLKSKNADIPLIAKIEKPEAIKNIDAILEASDGIMVARGDLGVEVSTEEVPILQKMLIRKANAKGRLVITATQMLESMTEHTRPTRAEAADVANAVFDGTDALMLSAETSAGKYPIEAVSMMDRIIRTAEGNSTPVSHYQRGASFSEAVSDSAAQASSDISAKYIVAFTQSGNTAFLISHFRPSVPILAFSTSEAVLRKMSLFWGVTPLLTHRMHSTDEVFKHVEERLLELRLVKKGDSIVITASSPILGQGKTNLLKLQTIGK